MSWNKHTIKSTTINDIIEVLKETEQTYSVKVLGMVVDRGMDSSGDLELRRLHYGSKVVLEYVLRSSDCDADDVVVAVKFGWHEEPKAGEWLLEIWPPEEV